MGDKLLPSQRSNVILLERSRVFVENETVVHATTADGVVRIWNVPHVNTSVVLLGQGTSITQAAARKLAEEKVLIAFTGTGGTPIFSGSLSEYAPTEHLRRWIAGWGDPKRRLDAAKHLANARLDFIDKAWPKAETRIPPFPGASNFREGIVASATVEQLRGYEGDYAKGAYAHVARSLNVYWAGRTDHPREMQDDANRMLDQGNYLAYGLAGVVLWSLGIPPGLAVNHGATRAGGLVFDLADVVKDGLVLPRAFIQVSRSGSRDFRERLIEDFDRMDVLPHLFAVMKETIERMAPA